MSETPETQQQQVISPLDFLKTIPGAPSETMIEAWKSEVPGGRLRVFTPDGTPKRVFIVRGLSGLEMSAIMKAVEGSNEENKELLSQIRIVCAGIVWTNLTKDGKVDEMTLRKWPAGLTPSLVTVVQILSDFIEPAALEILSAEL